MFAEKVELVPRIEADHQFHSLWVFQFGLSTGYIGKLQIQTEILDLPIWDLKLFGLEIWGPRNLLYRIGRTVIIWTRQKKSLVQFF